MLPGLKAYLRNRVLSLTNRNKSREERLKDELRFWDRWLRTKGLEWPDQFRDRLNPDLPLSPTHRRFIDRLSQEEVQILDVGAGPLTVVGKKHPQKRLTIHAIDVLAESYDALLERYGIQPPVRTRFAEAENLTRWFAEDSFDFVNARNCLDHGVEPVEAVRQILLVTKRGCYALLEHIENEGEKQSYVGLHQWNFSMAGGDFIVRGRQTATNISRELAHLGDFQCSVEQDWIKVSIRRK
jgi:SAM-dependent methyltransferase